VDDRDATTWVTLELTKAGEDKAVDGTLAKALRSELGVDSTHPVFVPYTSYEKGGRRVVVGLIEGYSFIASGLPETRYFALEKGNLVSQVISSKGIHGVRVIHAVPNSRILSLKSQLHDSISSTFEIGTQVRVIGGNYSRLEGVIVDILNDKAAVRITLRSIDVVAWIPLAAIDSNLNPDEYDVPFDQSSVSLGDFNSEFYEGDE
jgi:transcription antitermination factor NusG